MLFSRQSHDQIMSLNHRAGSGHDLLHNFTVRFAMLDLNTYVLYRNDTVPLFDHVQTTLCDTIWFK